MAIISLKGKANAKELADSIIRYMEKSGVTTELVESMTRQVGSVTVYIMVFEKYFMRSSNRASLSVILTAEGSDITADIIGSGGGQSALFRFSWGAEESFISVAENMLREENFTDI